MSRGNRFRVSRRAAAVVVAASVVAGGGVGWAVSGDGGDRTAAKASATSTPSPSSTPSATPSQEAAPAAGSGTSSGTGSLTVFITTPSGENPLDARFVVIDAATGREVGPESGTLADAATQTATLTGIPPGTYVVSAGSDDDRWQAAWYGPPSADYDRANATPITIGAGENPRITITLREFPNGEPPATEEPEPTPEPSPTATPSPSSTPQ